MWTMQVAIDAMGRSYLQSSGLSVAMANALTGTNGLKAPVSYMVPGTSLLADTFTVSWGDGLQAFVSTGTCGDYDVVPISLSSATFTRQAVAANGCACRFDGAAIGVVGQGSPNVVTIAYLPPGTGPRPAIATGLVQAMSDTASNSSQAQSPGFVTSLDPNQTVPMPPPGPLVYVFLLSCNVAVGTIVPPQTYIPSPVAAANRLVQAGDLGMKIGLGLQVDVSQPSVQIHFDTASKTFLLG
jgi:hypothetical protein